jgi:hypothetical protein
MPATAKHVSGRCIKAASNLDRAKDWFDDCLRNHNHDRDEAATRPSRLIAIGTADGSESIKLVDGSNTDKTYLAVSYRWGAETLLTTTGTFELFHTSIPWNQLPRTFQDAINIARELGIVHVWIDSLCIIQDSLVDWETESARMADIYKGALLTIMAASAADSQEGFFRDRATTMGMVALPYADASGATELSVFVSKALPSFKSFMSSAALFRRGWVFQERLMSKRKLIFGKYETYWECDGIVQSESKIQSRDEFELWYLKENATFGVFSDPLHKTDGVHGRTSPAYLWQNVVEQYSRCALTYEADRLPALSGLARTFARRFGGSYAAGLWQNQMPYTLLWFNSSWNTKETYEGEYRAPSWSWASTTGEVVIRGCHRGKQELDVVNIDIKLAGGDPYGRVCPGSNVCVRGRLRSGTLVKIEGSKFEAWFDFEHGRLLDRIRLDRRDEDPFFEVVCLEVSSGCGERTRQAGCLLLRKTGEDKHFRRVGMTFLRRDEDCLFHGLQKEVITLV